MRCNGRANIPPWVLNLIQSLPEENQALLVQVGSRAIMDPWFGALASIPIALNLVYVPHALKIAVAIPKLQLKYNNVTPRETNWDDTFGKGAVSNFLKRCTACHLNGFEAFVAFAPAVILCKLQKANGAEVRELCMRFLKLRLLYTFLYVFGAFRIISIARTLTFGMSMEVVSKLYVKALLA